MYNYTQHISKCVTLFFLLNRSLKLTLQDALPSWAAQIPDDIDPEDLLLFDQVPNFEKFSKQELEDYGSTSFLQVGKHSGSSFIDVAADCSYCSFLQSLTWDSLFQYFNKWYTQWMKWHARHLLANIYMSCRPLQSMTDNMAREFLSRLYLTPYGYKSTGAIEEVGVVTNHVYVKVCPYTFFYATNKAPPRSTYTTFMSLKILFV